MIAVKLLCGVILGHIIWTTAERQGVGFVGRLGLMLLAAAIVSVVGAVS